MLNSVATKCAAVIVAGLAMAATLSPAVQAQNISALQEQVLQLYQARKHAEGSALAERLVPMVRAKFGEGAAELADAINMQAWAYSAQGRRKEAMPLFEQALDYHGIIEVGG
jgi:tetratricopeptide (TPR) repeat protein